MDRIAASLASSNEHKLRELRAALPGWDLELLGAAEFPEEVGGSYYENALAKARFGRTISAGWVLGEDSGIEVEALAGGPGLESARWVPGEHVERLLEKLNGVEDRRARYVCELVCLTSEGDELRGTGILDGRIAEGPSGDEGFGYDPVFVPEGETRTVAELGNGWKAASSHRTRAARALLDAIKQAPELLRRPAARGGRGPATS
jgi:XTP/dITP diphosphohydrolase